MRRHHDFLFSNTDWFAVDQHQRKALAEEIAGLNGDRLLNTSVDDLCEYFEKKYWIEVPLLQTDDIVADQSEAQIDVSRDPNRYIRDRDRPFMITGTAIEVTIPFVGDAEVFNIQPTSYTLSPPRAEIRGQTLVLRIVGTDLSAERVRNDVDRTLTEIEAHLKTLRGNAQGLNKQLRDIAKDVIENRRKKLLADRNLIGALGFKMKERAGAPRTYTAPEVRRKITPTLPAATAVPFKPEPTLADTDYHHIISVIQNMAHVMERSPSAFVHMDEESLRSHFLVQLNGHYEGQATGETFNYQGKTDILIRSEGKNIFIAECKFWGGPKKLTETVDQLLSYSSWRDTKVAVILFNKNKDFSKVLSSIPDTVNAHPNFKRDLGASSESVFRYIFAHRDDRNRELILSILVFDIPS